MSMRRILSMLDLFPAIPSIFIFSPLVTDSILITVITSDFSSIDHFSVWVRLLFSPSLLFSSRSGVAFWCLLPSISFCLYLSLAYLSLSFEPVHAHAHTYTKFSYCYIFLKQEIWRWLITIVWIFFCCSEERPLGERWRKAEGERACMDAYECSSSHVARMSKCVKHTAIVLTVQDERRLRTSVELPSPTMCSTPAVTAVAPCSGVEASTRSPSHTIPPTPLLLHSTGHTTECKVIAGVHGRLAVTVGLN